MKPEDFSTNGERLLYIQTHLKAPKTQRNTFANYDYRSTEDINEAMKPLQPQVGVTVVSTCLTPVEVGGRVFMPVVSTIKNVSDDTSVAESTSYTEIPVSRKGMGIDQISGCVISYGTKYSLGLCLRLDDTRDADSMKPEQETPKQTTPVLKPPPPPMKRIITFDNFVKQEKLPAKLVTAFLEEKAMTDNSTLEGMQEKALSKPKSFVTAFNKWFEDRKAA